MENVFAGQRILFHVTLFAQSRFTGSPRFDIPDVPGVIIMEVEDRPVLGSIRDNGSEFLTKTHEFAVFPQVHGDFEIPSFPVSFAYVDNSTNQAIQGTHKTNSIRFSVQQPEGSEFVEFFVSTVQFTVRQTWEPLPQNPKKGDAYVRTITQTAKDIPGMVMLPILPEETEGLSIYHDPPRVKDKMQRGEFTGSRVETITYVCAAEGLLEIPALHFHWFDLKSGTLKEEILPAVNLDVAPNPELLPRDERSGVQTPKKRFDMSRTAVIAGFFVIFFLFIMFKYKSRISHAWLSHQDEKTRSEKYKFKTFKTACLSGDDANVFNAMVSWLECLMPGTVARPFKTSLQITDHKKLLKEFRLLEKRLFCPETHKSKTPGSNQELFAQAVIFRKKVLKEQQKISSSQNGLQLLNP